MCKTGWTDIQCNKGKMTNRVQVTDFLQHIISIILCILKGYLTMVSHFKIVYHALLDSYESDMNQIYMTDKDKKPALLYLELFKE